jgi:hypothetical protein
MPVVASPLPAMRAYFLRNVRMEDGRSIVRPELEGSTMWGDLAEVLHQTSALDITLHREDGSLVVTEMVGIQDADHAMKSAQLEIALYEAAEYDEPDDGDFLDELESPLEFDDDGEETDVGILLEDGFKSEWTPDDDSQSEWKPDDDPPSDWQPTERLEVIAYRFDAATGRFYSAGREFYELPKFPRYQIHVLLEDEESVP